LLHRNEQFKVWSAEHVIFGGTKLVSGQHGGGYGTRFFMGWNEFYEFSIVDRFLSWGWSNNSTKVVVPACVQTRQSKFSSGETGGLLIILGPVTRNSDVYPMLCLQSNSSYVDYFKALIDSLPKRILEQTKVRPKNASAVGKPGRVSAHQISELLGNSIEIDKGEISLNESQNQNRLSVVTYNETTIPINLLAGYPTVAMWDLNYVRLTTMASIVYNELFKAKILHYTPESAAQHIADVWDDVDVWWTSDEVIQARETFCENFARHSKFPALQVAKALADYR
jgi:putative transferase (TIGR04331 family)